LIRKEYNRSEDILTMRYNTLLLLVAFKFTGILAFAAKRWQRKGNNEIKVYKQPRLFKFPEPIPSTWDEGEVPWDIDHGNFTSVSLVPSSIYPVSPSAVVKMLVYKI
jgi:hypothetical protein